MKSNTKPSPVLDRRDAIPSIVGDHTDFLIITGLAGVAQDLAEITQEAPHAFMFGGAMGGATMTALGLALAQPERRVLCATGDGDLLMSLGSLATIGVLAPKNLAILCVDNEHYGETGNQETHTRAGVDLRAVAEACGFSATLEVNDSSKFERASQMLRNDGPSFVLLRVTDGPSRRYSRSWDCVERKLVFRAALLGPNHVD
jgi:thiamine pyrophosphate-dependent acetolactate synthase large subunit-like protein